MQKVKTLERLQPAWLSYYSHINTL